MLALGVDVGLEGLEGLGGAGRAEGDVPVAVVRPTLIGQGAVGAVLQVTPGQWSGTPAPVLTLAWWRDGVAVPGETGTTYAIQPGDAGSVLYACVTAQNDAGTVEICTPLMPVWPNQTVPAWSIQGLSPAAMTILRAPGPSDLPSVSGGADIVLT